LIQSLELQKKGIMLILKLKIDNKLNI